MYSTITHQAHQKFFLAHYSFADWFSLELLAGCSPSRPQTTKGTGKNVRITQLGKPYCALVALVLIPAAGRCDVVQDWNAIMQSTVSSQNPVPQNRFAAITQLAVFEAVNAITQKYQPYLGTVMAPNNASPEAAAVAAAHIVLKTYFPANATALDTARAASLAAIPDGPAKTNGIAVGEAAAAAMIAARANDGSAPAAFYLPTSTAAGVWQPTPSCTAAGGAFFQWKDITPFGIQSGSQFRLGPPVLLTSARYTMTYDEVAAVGATDSTQRPQDRADVARFYAATSPVAVWNDVARQLSTVQGKSLSENAHDFALINMALADGSIATFDSKYHYKFWRPETAIHNALNDGNDQTAPNATYAPYVVTPCFPSYPSAHGTLSNAARGVLEASYGSGFFSITLTNAAVAGVLLKYNTLTQITDDISDARVFGGIHFRTDQDAGATLGTRVAQYVLSHNLRDVNVCSNSR
jgi:hypothetical protein